MAQTIVAASPPLPIFGPPVAPFPPIRMDPHYQHRMLDEIDTRQNEVIDQLDDLNAQIEAVIQQIVGDRSETVEESPNASPASVRLKSAA